jgi:phosphoribosylanthranilate isomerase
MPYEENCDFFLFDTNGKLPGGNGYAFEWNILKHYPSKKSFFLSGGIGIDNMVQIKKILKRTLPIYAIDVNSKFEIAPGIKKIKALKEFKKEIDEL